MDDKINAFVDQLEPKLIGYRRDIHKHAEAAWTEFRTASIIARKLKDLGYKVLMGREVTKEEDRMGIPSPQDFERHFERAVAQGADPELVEAFRGGFTGVVGVLECGAGPVIGMRFDFDAVDNQESTSADHRPTREGWASVNPNVMHSCGHDGHAAIGLGVAETLMQIKDQLKGTIKLVFQPAEEGVRGAKAIVGSGILDDVQYMLAGHLSSGTKTGILYCGQDGYLATSKFDAIFTGAPAHAGGSPEGGHNALLAAATAVLNLYAIPRHHKGATRINVGRLSAGTGRNVICPRAHLAIETRGETSELNQHMYDYAMRILHNAANMHGCQVEIVAMGGAQSGQSDPELMERVRQVASDIPDVKEIPHETRPGGGSEDYTYMMERVQKNGGLATFMGIGSDLGGWGHHTAEFDIDESALKGAVKVFVAMVLDLVK